MLGLLLSGLTACTSPVACPLYAGGRAEGTSRLDSIWWGQPHGLPVVAPAELSSWAAGISFTLTEAQLGSYSWGSSSCPLAACPRHGSRRG